MALRFTTPCSADWDAMRGEGEVRRCEVCDREVHDLTHASAADAARLLPAPEGRLPCVRAWARRDGTILLGALAAVALAACAPHAAPPATVATEGARVCPIRTAIPAGEVWFAVVDDSGLPIPTSLLTMTSPAGAVQTTTDAEGRAVLGATPGVWRWRIEMRGFAPAEGEVVVPTGEGVGLAVELRLHDYLLTLGGIEVVEPVVDTESAKRGLRRSSSDMNRLPR